MLGGKSVKEYSSELTKVWSCLKLLLTKVSKLDSRGFKELPTVCATGVNWVVIVCLLLKMDFSQPPFVEDLHVSKLSQAGGEEKKS